MSTTCLFEALKSKVGNPYRKLLLITLADIANEQNQCWPSHEYLAGRAECKKRSVIDHLAALEREGFIRIQRRFSDDGQQTSNLYTITIDGVHEMHGGGARNARGGCMKQHGGGASDAHNTPIDTPIDTKDIVGLEKNEISEHQKTADRVIGELNSQANKKFRLNTKNRDYVIARLNDGYTEQDCLAVIANRCRRWLNTDQAEYLRPSTLFRPANFEGYLNDKGPQHCQAAPGLGQSTRDRTIEADLNDTSWAN